MLYRLYGTVQTGCCFFVSFLFYFDKVEEPIFLIIVPATQLFRGLSSGDCRYDLVSMVRYKIGRIISVVLLIPGFVSSLAHQRHDNACIYLEARVEFHGM